MKPALVQAGILVCVFSLVACNKNSGGGAPAGPQGLSDSQQQRFDSTASSIGQVSKWNLQGSGGAGLVAMTSAQSSQAAAKTSLEKKIAAQQLCDVQVIKPDIGDSNPGSVPRDIKMGMTVQGANCPISFALKTNMNMKPAGPGQQGSAKVDFSILYKAVSDEAKSALEVQDYSFNVSLSASDASVAGSGEGYVVTKTDGRIRFGFSAGGGGDSAFQTLTLTYPDGMVVELKEVDTKSGQDIKRAFFINGEAVDQKTFQSYMMKLMPGMPGQQDGSSDEQQDDGSTLPSGGSGQPSGPSLPNPDDQRQPTPGQPSEDQTPGSSGVTLSYDYTSNGCATGKHAFKASTYEGALAQLCAALQSESLNNHCALELRNSAFKEQCPGQVFQSKP